MKKYIIKNNDLIKMPKDILVTYMALIRSGSFRLLGLNWKKYIRWYKDIKTNDIVIEYK